MLADVGGITRAVLNFKLRRVGDVDEGPVPSLDSIELGIGSKNLLVDACSEIRAPVVAEVQVGRAFGTATDTTVPITRTYFPRSFISSPGRSGGIAR